MLGRNIKVPQNTEKTVGKGEGREGLCLTGYFSPSPPCSVVGSDHKFEEGNYAKIGAKRVQTGGERRGHNASL
ncbi:hypothetical protein Ddc_21134 [Ditylenchus destructor]|nr:hypothetical protein Ddc_21134 [Ditylenchus destructor]